MSSAAHRKRQQFDERAAGSQHPCGAQGDEISRYVGAEQTMQRKVAGGIDISAVHAQEDGQAGFHGHLTKGAVHDN